MTSNQYDFKPRAELLDQWARGPKGNLVHIPSMGPVLLRLIERAMFVAVGLAAFLAVVYFITGNIFVLLMSFIVIASSQGFYWTTWLGTNAFVEKEKKNYYGF